MERCPVCRARWRDVVCYRCGADLTPLLHMEQRAQALEASGVRKYAAGDHSTAAALLEKSLRCQRRPLAMALAAYLKLDEEETSPVQPNCRGEKFFAPTGAGQ